jgi:hypothetical protein
VNRGFADLCLTTWLRRQAPRNVAWCARGCQGALDTRSVVLDATPAASREALAGQVDCPHDVEPALRAPAPAHRLQPARRRGAHQGPDRLGEGSHPRRSLLGDDRSRQHARRDRVLQDRCGGGGEADHRARGLCGSGLALRSRPSRRRSRWRVVPPHAPGEGHAGLPEPLRAVVACVSRGLLHEAAYRPRAPPRARAGGHRPLRLPRGADPARAPRRRRGGGAGDVRALPRPLRRRLLRRDPGPRPRGAASPQPDAARPRRPLRRRDGGHQRRSLREEGGRPGPRGAPGDPDEDDALRSEPLPLPVRRVLRQDPGRDGAHHPRVGLSRGARQHARRRRPLPARAADRLGARLPDARGPCARGADPGRAAAGADVRRARHALSGARHGRLLARLPRGGRPAARSSRRRPWSGSRCRAPAARSPRRIVATAEGRGRDVRPLRLRPRRLVPSRRRRRAGTRDPRARRVRARRDRSHGLRRLLPHRGRLHRLGEVEGDRGRSRSRGGGGGGGGGGAFAPCCSSASSTPNACRCPTSTSTSPTPAAAR